MVRRSSVLALSLSMAALLSGAVLLSSARDADQVKALRLVQPKARLELGAMKRFRAPAPIQGRPALHPDGTMYVAALDGVLYAISVDGKVRWKRDLGAASFGGVLRSTEGDLYVGTDAGRLWSFDARGTLRFVSDLGAAIETEPAQSPRGYVVVCAGREVVSVSQDGKVGFRFRAWGKFFAHPVIAENGDIFVGSEDGNFYAIHADGSERYRVYAGAAVGADAVLGDQGFAYFADERGRVHAVDEWSDEPWVKDMGTPVRGPLARAPSGELLVLTQGPRVRLVALAADTGAVVAEQLLALTDGPDPNARAGVLVDAVGRVWLTTPGDRLWSFPHFAQPPSSARVARGATTTPQIGAQGHLVLADRSGQLLWIVFGVNRSLPP